MRKSQRPQDNPGDEGIKTPGQVPVIPPTPSNPTDTKEREDAAEPWWKAVRWKAILEVVGIIAGIGYAITTFLPVA